MRLCKIQKAAYPDRQDLGTNTIAIHDIRDCFMRGMDLFDNFTKEDYDDHPLEPALDFLKYYLGVPR